jgi:hypothetical protein
MTPNPLDLDLMDGAVRGIANAVRRARLADVLSDEPHLDGYAWARTTELSADDPPFATLIAAALLKADGTNAGLIRACWPGIAADAAHAYAHGAPPTVR